jgi:hypothetical protein
MGSGPPRERKRGIADPHCNLVAAVGKRFPRALWSAASIAALVFSQAGHAVAAHGKGSNTRRGPREKIQSGDARGTPKVRQPRTDW